MEFIAGPMVAEGDLEMGGQRVELVVFELRQGAACNGQRVGKGVLHHLSRTGGSRPQERHVERGIVGNKRSVSCKGEQGAQRLALLWRVFDHFVGDAGQLGDFGRNGLLGVDKGLKTVENLALFHKHGANFGQAFAAGRRPVVSTSKITNSLSSGALCCSCPSSSRM